MMENRNVPPQGARKFVFAEIKTVFWFRSQFPISLIARFLGDLGLRNGLAKKSTANYRLGFKIDD